MDFTTEFLDKLKSKSEIKLRYGNYLYRMSMGYENAGKFALGETYLKKCNRIKSCLDTWVWDKYEKNKLLDLQKLNRCNYRCCPVCRTWDIAKAIHNLKPGFNLMLQEYDPYLVTLTVPNCTGAELKQTIEKINKAFSKLYLWLNQPTIKGYRGFKDRVFELKSGIRVLEITLENKRKDYYHPHLHCVFFLPRYNKSEFDNLFDKYIKGAYQRKTKQILYYSNADIHLMRLWKFAYDGIKLSDKNWNDLSLVDDEWYNLYQCDIRPMNDPNGIYEVLKYTYKDSDIKTFENFKTIYLALENKRIRQTFGELYNIDLEKECGEMLSIEDFLEVEKSELPQQLITREIHSLTNEYKDFKKISRFKVYHDLEKVSTQND